MSSTDQGPGAAAAGGGLTDTQLRATPVPVSGTVTATGPLTDTQLRASAVPVSAASLPLPTGAATETTLGAVAKDGTPITGQALEAGGASSQGWLSSIRKAITDRLPAALVSGRLDVNVGASTTIAVTNANLDVALSTRTKPSDQQHVIVDSSASIAVAGPLTDTQLRATPVPVSGSVTANAGTNLNTSLLALEAGHLATIDTSTAKIPAQGQAVAAASMPVVLPAAQVTTLTPPTNAGYALDASLATIDTDIKATQPRQIVGNAAISDNYMEVAASGVPQQFPNVAAKTVALTANRRNRSVVVIGGAAVVAAPHLTTGVALRPGDTVVMPVSNLNVLYASAMAPHDRVAYAVLA